VTSSDDFILPIPYQAVHRKQAGRNIQHGPRWLFRRAGVHNRDAAVMASEGERIAARREGHSMNPSRRIIQEFSADGIEGETLAPRTWLWAGINALDEARENPSMGISRPRRQQDRVRVPGQGGDCAPDGLLQMLRNPPIVLFLEVADRNHSSPGSDGKLLLGRRPSHKRRGPVDSEKDQSWLPARGSFLPDVGVAVWQVGKLAVSLVRDTDGTLTL
jgi:hypothetical protein